MEENKAHVEIYDDDSVVELFDENDKSVEFREIASIELDGKFYELLQPVEPLDGIGEDEAVIFEYTEGDTPDERNFTPLFDEELLERVFNEYLKASSECDCGCDCCDCEDDECDCDHEQEHCDCGHCHS